MAKSFSTNETRNVYKSLPRNFQGKMPLGRLSREGDNVNMKIVCEDSADSGQNVTTQ
jgi:hypothetical protein